MTPTPEERRIREDVEFDNTAHGDDIRELLAEYDHRGTALIARDVALRMSTEENERLATELARVTQELADEEAVHEQWRQRVNEADRIHAALTGERRTRQQLWNILGRTDGVGLDIELLDAVADAIDSRNRYRAELDRLEGADLVIRCDDPAHQERDQLHAALTELRAASRGLAFFDQIKCARWNAAFEQAGRVLGLEDET